MKGVSDIYEYRFPNYHGRALIMREFQSDDCPETTNHSDASNLIYNRWISMNLELGLSLIPKLASPYPIRYFLV